MPQNVNSWLGYALGAHVREGDTLMVTRLDRFETEIRAERQMDGIRNAKANGVLLGRRKHLTEEEQVELQLKRQEGVRSRRSWKNTTSRRPAFIATWMG